MSTTPVTRFAPSPTGHLHIGGARTALFNWALARQHKDGRFILRIEDTDRARSTLQSTLQIIKDLKWLGIDWDEGPDGDSQNPENCQRGDHGPYFQSQRLNIYHQYVDQLIEAGRAYKCFKSPQELAAEREQARSQKRAIAYDPTLSRSLTPQQIADFEAQGKPNVVRFAVPESPIEIQDDVLGNVSVQAGQIEDFVILKSDGFPTYHMAVVVDDKEMGITHVIRGQEHLNNAPKHAALQDALGFERPRFAHIPLIFNPDGSKMSKRDKAKVARATTKDDDSDQVLHKIKSKRLNELGNESAVESTLAFENINNESVDQFKKKKTDHPNLCKEIADTYAVTLPDIDVYDFQKSGYLPEVVTNYIALLGWSPGENIERFDSEFLIEHFSLDRVGKSNARFDREKLSSFNGESLATMEADEFAKTLQAHLQQHHGAFFNQIEDCFELFAKVYQKRSRTLDDPAHLGQFLVEDQVESYDHKAVKKFLEKNDGQGFQILRDLQDILNSCHSCWDQTALEQKISDYASTREFGLKQIAQPLRIALSGSTVTPPIYDTLVIMGYEKTMTKIVLCTPNTTKTPT